MNLISPLNGWFIGKKKTPLDSVLGTLDSLLPDTLKPSVLKNWMPKEQPNITKSDPTAGAFF